MKSADITTMIAHIGIGEVAKLLGVTEQTVRAWESEGKLVPAYRTAGKQRRYRLSDVESVINTGEFRELLYRVMYANLAPLPDEFVMYGMVYSNGFRNAGKWADNSPLDDGESYVDVGTYRKSSHPDVRVVGGSPISELVIDPQGEKSRISGLSNFFTPAPYAIFKKHLSKPRLDVDLFDRTLRAKISDSKDVLLSNENAWGKLPRVILGYEHAADGSVIQVYFNRVER